MTPVSGAAGAPFLEFWAISIGRKEGRKGAEARVLNAVEQLLFLSPCPHPVSLPCALLPPSSYCILSSLNPSPLTLSPSLFRTFTLTLTPCPPKILPSRPRRQAKVLRKSKGLPRLCPLSSCLLLLLLPFRRILRNLFNRRIPRKLLSTSSFLCMKRKAVFRSLQVASPTPTPATPSQLQINRDQTKPWEGPKTGRQDWT